MNTYSFPFLLVSNLSWPTARTQGGMCRFVHFNKAGRARKAEEITTDVLLPDALDFSPSSRPNQSSSQTCARFANHKVALLTSSCLLCDEPQLITRKNAGPCQSRLSGPKLHRPNPLYNQSSFRFETPSRRWECKCRHASKSVKYENCW